MDPGERGRRASRTCRMERLFGPAGTRGRRSLFDRFEQLGEGRVLGQKRQEWRAVELLAIGRVFEEPGVGGPLEELEPLLDSPLGPEPRRWRISTGALF